MADEIKIELPFMFEFSNGGKIDQDCVITLRAPTFQDFKLHAAFKAHLATAGTNIGVKFAGVKAQRSDEEEAERAARKLEEDKRSDEERAAEQIDLLAAGLGPDAFPQFVDWAQKQLTNNPRVAVIGDGPHPLRDAVWNDIGAKGGMESVMRIIGTFLLFFGKRPNAASTTGSVAAPGSHSLRAVQ